MAGHDLATLSDVRDEALSDAHHLYRQRWFLLSLIFVIATAMYLGCVLSPPSLMDDVDAVQAQIAKTMLTTGDWVTARLDGVVYLDQHVDLLNHLYFKIHYIRWVKF